MSTSLQEYIQFLQRPIEDPPTEPELDDIDEKTDQLVRYSFCFRIYSTLAKLTSMTTQITARQCNFTVPMVFS